MIYFTSDLHLGHENIIRLNDRPFENVEDMNRVLIQNWNSFVKKNDFIYILGDLTMKLPLEKANQIISRLNGRKILIREIMIKTMMKIFLKIFVIIKN
ncbi:hypothetical protein NMU03_08205 [Allocoprobacillus halotolerans]|uniref:Calcineurin-like phosphoesterase domain-containing protein n=1 Tax=Allocoprobacillus halotolerans TaxID=2944914 RepID=A0ABY5I8M6_9FIRM|nr:hypothetical protein [Allocoprobacillus halotolerans]UTY40724.1 hypothetical protein NMU03_08205 [Allocoprobacillus halotolerans]